MRALKKVLFLLLLAAIVFAGIRGYLWHGANYVRIDSQLYPRDMETLDLREKQISIRQYERFRSQLPECQILWNVPFQGGFYPEDTRELTITALSKKDMDALAYLPRLETVDATNCTDYDQLLVLKERFPQLDVRYSITLGGETYAPDVREIEVTAIADSDLSRLDYLPELQRVILLPGEEVQDHQKLRSYCRDRGIRVLVPLGDELISADATDLILSDLETEDFYALALLPELKTLHLIDPQTTMDVILDYQSYVPGLTITWKQSLCGMEFDTDAEEIDLSGNQIEDLDALEEQLTFFPNVKKLILSHCGIDNETLAAFREEHRADYKVVWTVQLGDKLTARTDDTTFMPVRENVYYFQDHESVNLKYCEDMVCIDVGHMAIHDISFVEYMPNLKYLILAHTEVRDITPLENCKNLIFLELDWSTVRDFTPLLGCTALEDLNVGKTYPDLAPLAQMTWLKNLWMVDRTTGAYEVTQALTNTKIVTSGSATVAGGWRELPNYYAMRDLLGMEYMTW